MVEKPTKQTEVYLEEASHLKNGQSVNNYDATFKKNLYQIKSVGVHANQKQRKQQASSTNSYLRT